MIREKHKKIHYMIKRIIPGDFLQCHFTYSKYGLTAMYKERVIYIEPVFKYKWFHKEIIRFDLKEINDGTYLGRLVARTSGQEHHKKLIFKQVSLEVLDNYFKTN